MCFSKFVKTNDEICAKFVHSCYMANDCVQDEEKPNKKIKSQWRKRSITSSYVLGRDDISFKTFQFLWKESSFF